MSRAFQVELAESVLEWLANECHADSEVRRKVRARFEHIFELLEEHGERLGGDHIDHIQRGLYEMRVNHSTGCYWIFFGFTPGSIVAAAHAGVKKRPRFPQREYDLAEEKVREYIVALTGKHTGGKRR